MNIASIVLALTTMMSANANTATNANEYTLNGNVIEVDDDLVTIADSNGNAWEYYAYNWNVGDKCILTMDSKGTEEVEDDKIINFKYDFNLHDMQIINCEANDYNTICNRKGNLVVEHLYGIVTNDNLDGYVINSVESEFNYISYRCKCLPEARGGLYVETWIVYSPYNNESDDIIYRWDKAIMNPDDWMIDAVRNMPESYFEKHPYI